jgi:uncharacterized protein with FMN-binding domain
MPTYRMHRGLVALSASAVAAIYMAGYLRTQAADASIATASVATPTTAVVAAPPPQTAAPTVQPLVQRAAPPVTRTQPTPVPQVAAPPAQSQSQTQTQTQAQGQYKDGTYTGQGTSRRGDVWVSVQVAGGRVTNVTITRSTLQYPLRDIQNLPQEVVQRQSAQVDLVSRATYSSMAFRGAVAQALSAAKA